MYTVLLMALGGVLIGGTWSLRQQGKSRMAVWICGILAVASLVAAWAVTYV